MIYALRHWAPIEAFAMFALGLVAFAVLSRPPCSEWACLLCRWWPKSKLLPPGADP